jgi:hypothetical protein
MSTPALPVIAKPIPSVEALESGAFGPIDFNDYIKAPDNSKGSIKFFMELTDGEDLPQGLLCTTAGLFGGRPAVGTAGTYEVNLIARFNDEQPLFVQMVLSIKPGLVTDDPNHLNNLKNQVWAALGKNQPPPNFADALNRPVTATEIYYLLQQYASLSIWDVYNLEPPGEKILLSLDNSSPYYNIYDRGSCLVGAPKDLFSFQRTLADALQTARVMAQEVFKRGWTIEFSGFNKMAKAAWVEIQLQQDIQGRPMEILHYSPTQNDLKLYAAIMQSKGISPMKSM